MRFDGDGTPARHWDRHPAAGDTVAVLTRYPERDFSGLITEVLDPAGPIVATTRPPYATAEDGASLEGERAAVEADKLAEFTAAAQQADLVRARQTEARQIALRQERRAAKATAVAA